MKMNEQTTEELKEGNREAHAEMREIRDCEREIKRRLKVKTAFLYDPDEDDYFACYVGRFRLREEDEDGTLYVFRSLPEVARGLVGALDTLKAKRRELYDRAVETSRELTRREKDGEQLAEPVRVQPNGSK
jgi:hypothetical protein